jgi:hypothetical protein
MVPLVFPQTDFNNNRFELMAEAQRDLTPEQAAAKLRHCSDKHYLDVLNKQGSG